MSRLLKLAEVAARLGRAASWLQCPAAREALYAAGFPRPRAMPGRLMWSEAEVAAWEAADPDGTSGSLSVTLDPCRIGAGPAPDARVSVAIRLEPGGPFLPLVRNGPISQVAGSDDIGALPQCG